MDSVLLPPHIASATHETREATGDLAFRNLSQFLTGGVMVAAVPG